LCADTQCSCRHRPRGYVCCARRSWSRAQQPIICGLRDAGIGKQDIDLPILLLHFVVQPVEIRGVGYVSAYACDVVPELRHGRLERALAATKRWAAANPMPLLPPVMTAALPVRLWVVVVIGRCSFLPSRCEALRHHARGAQL
jgi:hypothetical protein